MTSQPKTVFITGGSRGIGKALVDYFVERDWRVGTCATSEGSLDGSRAELAFVCDVGDVRQVKSAVRRLIDAFGQLQVLINNAGIAGSNPLAPGSSDVLWERIIQVNLNGTYYMSKYALPYVREQEGRIINIASVLGLKGVPDQTAYCAAKHGVIGFTRSLALYCAPRGITVNAICPGWVDTDMARGRLQELSLTCEKLEKTIPLGKVLKGKEVAAFAYYLCGPEAVNITGQAFTMDGGANL